MPYSEKTVGNFLTAIELLFITVGAGVVFHSFGAGILSFGITILVMDRWQ